MPEAKAQTGGAQDPSMEEILQSIRKIIAEEGEDGKGAAGDEIISATGSDVLELTDIVADDGSDDFGEEGPAIAPGDVLANIDEAIAPPPAPPPPPEPVVVAAPPPPPPPPEPPPPAPVEEVAPPVAAKPEPTPAPAAKPSVDDSLISEQAASATVEALKKIPRVEERPLNLAPSPSTRTGSTVEDLMVEAMKPMLKEWLDANLPQLVERIVEREIKKLI